MYTNRDNTAGVRRTTCITPARYDVRDVALKLCLQRPNDGRPNWITHTLYIHATRTRAPISDHALRFYSIQLFVVAQLLLLHSSITSVQQMFHNY